MPLKEIGVEEVEVVIEVEAEVEVEVKLAEGVEEVEVTVGEAVEVTEVEAEAEVTEAAEDTEEAEVKDLVESATEPEKAEAEAKGVRPGAWKVKDARSLAKSVLTRYWNGETGLGIRRLHALYGYPGRGHGKRCSLRLSGGIQQ
ncbi:hypothetical protein ABKA04_009836 [Annulohypoxylon sp. FPYF3050]